MSGVYRKLLTCVPACDERGNHFCPLEKAGAERIACQRSSRRRFENVSGSQFAENGEALKSLSLTKKKKCFLGYGTISGRLGGSDRASTHQDVRYRKEHFVHENRCPLPLSTWSSGRASSTVSRVQSVEGKSQGPDTNLAQKKVELFRERRQGNGEIPDVREEESELCDKSRGNAEPFDSVSSADPDGKLHSGNSRDVPSAVSHEESSDVSSDVETGMGPLEEQEDPQDYGTETTWEEEMEYVTTIPVPRQKYIPVPKAVLVNALLLLFFPANKDASKFLSICSHLEIILHAEHKVLLEELRSDYSLTHSVQDGSKSSIAKGATSSSKLGTASTERAQKLETIGEQADWPIDEEDGSSNGVKQPLKVLRNLSTKFMTALKQKRGGYVGIGENAEEQSSAPTSDVEFSEAAAERFQKNFVRILSRAEFEGISLRDLKLTAALNDDYLLSIPVDVDWKRTSTSNVKVFRRGYTKQEQKGLLLGEKFDYLQSLILRQIFKTLTGPLLNAGRWCIQKWNSLWNDKEGRELAESVSGWLQAPLRLEDEEPLDVCEDSTDHEAKMYDTEAQLDMPIWLAAGQAIPRYEAILTSAGSRGLLIRRILVRMGLLQQVEIPSQTLPNTDESALEPHLRPNYLSRVSMKDIWLPASQAVVGRNVWKRISAAFSVLFSQATLQEPAFKDLVLLYNMDADGDHLEAGLQLQTYKRIPLPDLKIVFPSKKLRFRVLDTLRLDVTSVAGLLAFTVNYHFDDFLSSPSAFVLDIIAASALIVLATRVGFGYKQVWDRYQLLVNKTLYQKTGAKGFGVVQFLIDESEEQQFKEAILVFTVLVHQGKAEGMTSKQLAGLCERILYYRCKAQVEMPVDSAVRTLLKFGLIDCVDEMAAANSHQGEVRYRALSYEQGMKALEQHWASVPSVTQLWN